MSDTQLLQAILDKVSAVDKKVDGLQSEMTSGFKKVNTRIDRLGKTLAFLEDDAPTREEFDELEKRVERIEKDASN